MRVFLAYRDNVMGQGYVQEGYSTAKVKQQDHETGIGCSKGCESRGNNARHSKGHTAKQQNSTAIYCSTAKSKVTTRSTVKGLNSKKSNEKISRIKGQQHCTDR